MRSHHVLLLTLCFGCGGLEEAGPREDEDIPVVLGEEPEFVIDQGEDLPVLPHEHLVDAEVIDDELLPESEPPILSIIGPEQVDLEECEHPPEELNGVATASAQLRPLHRPHWGSGAHHDRSCGQTGQRYWSRKFPTMSIFRWSGCHATKYYRIAPSIKAKGTAWIRAVERAFAAWDQPHKCSPHWVNVERGPSNAVARVTVEYRGAAGHCSSSTTWYACVIRDWARSTTDQHWYMNLNNAQPYGIGASNRLDVQSLVAVELAHILYYAHFPNYGDSISTSNVARWGRMTATLGSADSCWFASYTARCTNCGNRRALLAGDRALLDHLYADNPRFSH